jgi:hypothetical protein
MLVPLGFGKPTSSIVPAAKSLFSSLWVLACIHNTVRALADWGFMVPGGTLMWSPPLEAVTASRHFDRGHGTLPVVISAKGSLGSYLASVT